MGKGNLRLFDCQLWTFCCVCHIVKAVHKKERGVNVASDKREKKTGQSVRGQPRSSSDFGTKPRSSSEGAIPEHKQKIFNKTKSDSEKQQPNDIGTPEHLKEQKKSDHIQESVASEENRINTECNSYEDKTEEKSSKLQVENKDLWQLSSAQTFPYELESSLVQNASISSEQSFQVEEKKMTEIHEKSELSNMDIPSAKINTRDNGDSISMTIGQGLRETTDTQTFASDSRNLQIREMDEFLEHTIYPEEAEVPFFSNEEAEDSNQGTNQEEFRVKDSGDTISVAAGQGLRESADTQTFASDSRNLCIREMDDFSKHNSSSEETKFPFFLHKEEGDSNQKINPEEFRVKDSGDTISVAADQGLRESADTQTFASDSRDLRIREMDGFLEHTISPEKTEAPFFSNEKAGDSNQRANPETFRVKDSEDAISVAVDQGLRESADTQTFASDSRDLRIREMTDVLGMKPSSESQEEVPADIISPHISNFESSVKNNKIDSQKKDYLSDTESDELLLHSEKSQDSFVENSLERLLETPFTNTQKEKIQDTEEKFQSHTRGSDMHDGISDEEDRLSAKLEDDTENETWNRSTYGAARFSTMYGDGDSKAGINVKKTLVKGVRTLSFEAKLYSQNTLSNTYTGQGILTSHETVGRYVVYPAVGVVVGKSAGEIGKIALKSFNRSLDFDYIRTDGIFQKVVQPYIEKVMGMEYYDGVEDEIFNPRKQKNLHVLHKSLEEALKDRGISTNAKELRHLLRTKSLSAIEEKIVQAFIKTKTLEKYTNYAKQRTSKSIRVVRRNISIEIRRQIIKASRESQSYTSEGLLFSTRISRIAVKTIYRASKSTGKAAKYMKNVTLRTVKKAAPKVKKAAAASFKTGKAATKTGTHAAKKVFASGERLAVKVGSAGARKAAVMTSKTGAKLIRAGSKAAAAAIRVTLSLARTIVSSITAAAVAMGPVVVVVIIAVVIIALFVSVYMLDGSSMEASQQLVAQQYVDVLNQCHVKFRENIEKYYSDPTYETVTVNYNDKKNTKTYTDYKNEEGITNDDNNIKECMCLMAALFDFDLETYSPGENEDKDYIKEMDAEKLASFIEANDQSDEDYSDMTYQWLIRCYLIGLFNGSHEVQKNVTTTYCGGCVAVTDKDGNVFYNCPGHKHLTITVTTYYFDQLFNCSIKARSDALGMLNIMGSSTVEKVWNAMKSEGCTDEAAAAVVANLMAEGGGGPDDILLHTTETGGPGVGMCQWSGSRKQQFLSFLASKGMTLETSTAEAQIEFMIRELHSGQWSFDSVSGWNPKYNVSYEQFKSISDLEDATYTFTACFERPNINLAHMDTRVSYAQTVYQAYHGLSSGGGVGLQPGETTESLGIYHITYYCPCYECSEGYGRNTATGALATANHTIAVDPNVIPYGSRVLINGIVYTAEDCGGAINNNDIDIYVDTHAETLQGGSHYSEVFLVK